MILSPKKSRKHHDMYAVIILIYGLQRRRALPAWIDFPSAGDSDMCRLPRSESE